MGTSIISVFLYFRFLYKRSEYSLESLKLNVTNYYLFISFTLLLLHVIIICFCVFRLMIRNKEPKILQKLIESLLSYILWEPLNYILTKVAPHIPYSGSFFIFYAHFFIKTEKRLFFMNCLCFMFYFFPKILMSSVFLFEIIFLHQLKYFLYYFFILLIPIIYIILLNLSEKFYINNISDVLEGLNVKNEGTPNKYGVYTAHTFSIKKESEYTQDDLENLVECWQILFYLNNLNKILRLFINTYALYCTLFTSILYAGTFSYKLYYLLGF